MAILKRIQVLLYYDLNIDSNEIGDEGAIAIGKYLEKNSNLGELSLSLLQYFTKIDENCISSIGATPLSEALEKNSSLTTLYLSTFNAP